MVLEPQYKTNDYLVSASTFNKGIFGILQNRRKISSGTVRDIAAQLATGVHFDSPIVVNKVNGEMFIIDGNHRYEAIKRYLHINPRASVRVRIALYENLDDDESKIVYTRWNKGRKQSTNDVVAQYADEITLFKYLNPSVDVYGHNSKVSFFKVVGAYMAAQDPVFRGGYIGSAFDFVDAAMAYGEKDAKIINAFLGDYELAFGVTSKNSWYKTTPFTALFKIWYDNRKGFLPLDIQSRFGNLTGDASALYWHRYGGASSCTTTRKEYLTLLNGTRRKNLFVNADVNP